MIPLLYGALAGVLWGLNPVVIKRYGNGLDAVTVNGVRAFYAFTLLLVFIYLLGSFQTADLIGLVLIFASALIGPYFGDYFYVESIRRIGGGNAITIGYLYILVAQLASIAFLGEELSSNILVGTLLAILGVFLIYGGGNNVRDVKGYLLALFTAVFWGFSTIFSRLATNYGHVLFLTMLRNLYVFMLALAVRKKRVLDNSFSRRGFMLGFFAGGLSFGFGMALFIRALSVGGVSASTLPTIIAPLVGRILSAIINKEGFDAASLGGSLLIITGIGIGFIGFTG
ncbi:MAG: DMT family transporter [Thermosphaera sp.]